MSRTTMTFKVYRNETLVDCQRFDAEVIKLGNLPSSHIRIDDEAVARMHAVVEVVGEKEVKLIDLGSPAGTTLNGHKIEKFATLKDGDVMTLGNTRIQAQISNINTRAAAPVAAAQPQIDAHMAERLPLRILLAEDNLLTAQNFVLHAGGYDNSAIWRQILEIKGFRRSYLELTVFDRNEFLRVLTDCGYVINREPFWTIHKFDSARERTEYSHHPPLHFANDRANETDYGPNYFFVHWDGASPWFRKSKWLIRFLPGGWQLEQVYAALRHRRGSPCPQMVKVYLSSLLSREG